MLYQHLRIGTFVAGGSTSGSIPYIDSNNLVAQDNANNFWDATNHRLGIGTTSPNAKLTVGAALAGTALGTTFITNAGALGTTATNLLTLANIGFTSANSTSLGIRALRQTNGTDWTTTAIGIGMDVDSSNFVGASMWFSNNGDIGIGTSSPTSPLHITTTNSVVPMNLANTVNSAAIVSGFGQVITVAGTHTSGTLTNNIALELNPISSGTGGTTTSMITLFLVPQQTAGTVTTLYGVFWSPSGTYSNSYFLYEAVASQNYLSGNLGIGNATPTYLLDVVGGDIAVGTAGKGFRVKEGSNAKMGTVALVAGTATVSTTAVTANSRIFLTSQNGTLSNNGLCYVSARTAGTSFTIISTSGNLDTSTIAWLIFEPY